MKRELCGEPVKGMQLVFENFIVDKNNCSAYLICEAIADSLTDEFNPLFCYGGEGTGKTHLLKAIASQARSMGKKVLYSRGDYLLKGVEFMEDIDSGIKSLCGYADILLVDDVHYVFRNKSGEKFLSRLVELLVSDGKPVVLASEFAPDYFLYLDSNCKTFKNYTTVNIIMPERETRMEILENILNLNNTEFLPEVKDYLVDVSGYNIQKLKEQIEKYIILTGSAGEPLTLEFVKKYLYM